MGECDIWADREPGSCGEAPEKSPLKPFVPFPPQNELELCVTLHYCNSTREEQESVREMLFFKSIFANRKHC